MEDYFGGYQPDKYWVYENRTGTKKDSVYLIDYKREFSLRGPKICTYLEKRTFMLAGMNYLSMYDTIDIRFDISRIESDQVGYIIFATEDSKTFYKIKTTADSVFVFGYLPQMTINDKVFYEVY